MQSDLPELEEIIEEYKPKGQLAHENIVHQMAQAVQLIPAELDLHAIRQNTAALAIWPLIEKYATISNPKGHKLSRQENDRIERLDSLFSDSQKQEDIEQVRDTVLLNQNFGREVSVEYLNPYKLPTSHILRRIKTLKCVTFMEHLKRTKWSNMKIIHDSMMGSLFYLMINDSTFTQESFTVEDFIGEEKTKSKSIETYVPDFAAMHKGLICRDKNGKPVYFMDSIEGGGAYMHSLDHWRGKDEQKEWTKPQRIQHVYLNMAMAMYMAHKLNIDTIIPRDFELVELNKMHGLKQKMIFDREEPHWKAGLHSRRNHTGIYTHMLFRGKDRRDGHQVRHYVLQPHIFPYRNSAEIKEQLDSIAGEITSSNATRTQTIAPGSREKLQKFDALYQIMMEIVTPDISDPRLAYLYPRLTERKYEAYQLFKSTYRKMSKFGIKPPEELKGYPYVQGA